METLVQSESLDIPSIVTLIDPIFVPEVVVPVPSAIVSPSLVSPAIVTPLVSPSLVSPSLVVDKVDILYNKIILNSSLLITINNIKTNGFTNATIPLLIMSMTTTYNNYTTSVPAHKLTIDDIQVLLERVYNYLVDKYNLIDVADRLSMYTLFEASLTLCLAMPNVKKQATSCLNFLKC